MTLAVDAVLEDRIRERAYYIWEDNGRPIGRCEEFWQQARELVASDDVPPTPPVKRRRTKPQQQPTEAPRKRSSSRKAAATAGISATAG